MTHSIYIILLSITSITGWIGWFLVVTRMDPEELIGVFPYIMFYSTLFLAVTGTVSILSFYIRQWITKNEIYFEHLNIAIREGILAGFTVVGILFLQYFRVLTVWDALLIFIAMILLEIFVISKKRDREFM